jgi:hypothetical protein
MARCAECNTEIPDGIRHYFCGYGWYAQFCAACCPRKMDGTECDDEHPAPDLDTLIDSITEHSGPAHILPGPHVEEVVREVVAAEDNGWLQDALDLEQKRSVGPEEQRVFDTISALLGLHNARMKDTEEPDIEPPKAEDAAKDATAPQPSDDGLTWRQKPAQF